MKENNWLNKINIPCPNCKKEPLVCDHSPFENSYTMYGNLFPKRVDIGLYEPIYNEIKNYKELSYEDLILAFENRLENCACGGKHQLKPQRKCLLCQYPLPLKKAKMCGFLDIETLLIVKMKRIKWKVRCKNL